MLTVIRQGQGEGEMSELAEGARLEIACTTKSGTEGSNPSLSAITETLQYCLEATAFPSIVI